MSASSRIYLTNSTPASKYFASTDRSRVKTYTKMSNDTFLPEDNSSTNLSQNNGPSNYEKLIKSNPNDKIKCESTLDLSQPLFSYNPTVINSMVLMNTYPMKETNCVIEETKSEISPPLDE